MLNLFTSETCRRPTPAAPAKVKVEQQREAPLADAGGGANAPRHADEAAEAKFVEVNTVLGRAENGGYDEIRGRQLQGRVREFNALVQSAKGAAKQASDHVSQQLQAKFTTLERVRDFLKLACKPHPTFRETAHSFDLVVASGGRVSAKHASQVVLLKHESLLAGNELDAAIAMITRQGEEHGPHIVHDKAARDVLLCEMTTKIVAHACPAKIAPGVRTDDAVSQSRQLCKQLSLYWCGIRDRLSCPDHFENK